MKNSISLTAKWNVSHNKHFYTAKNISIIFDKRYVIYGNRHHSE